MSKHKSLITRATIVFLFMSPVCLAQQSAGQYEDLGQKTFTLEQEFKYFHQKYDDAVIEHYYDEQVEASDGPDQELVRFLSSILFDDFDWWQSIWDQATRDDWAAKASLNKAERSYNFWKARFNKNSKVELLDFIVMREYVCIGFKISNESANYYFMPFVQEHGLWRLDEAWMSTELYQKLSLQVSKSDSADFNKSDSSAE
jgi:hypothetical protein